MGDEAEQALTESDEHIRERASANVTPSDLIVSAMAQAISTLPDEDGQAIAGHVGKLAGLSPAKRAAIIAMVEAE